MNSPLKIKVCGMRDPENLEAVCALEPELVGFIFYLGSPRFVGSKPDPALFRIPARPVIRVGVFVDAPLGDMLTCYRKGMVNMLQLHGQESPQVCEALKKEGIPVIKALQPGALSGQQQIMDYAGLVDYLLFDTPTSGYGGSGRQFDWGLFSGVSLPKPFFLSGGISAGDVPALREFRHEKLFALDVNSRFEVQPGVKDTALLGEFIRAMRKEKK
jgi:phosphoribosylanthranilate isomerase